MRPFGRSETQSLYFEYPYFESPGRRDVLTRPVRVAIVGAGPIGMAAAISLAQQGIASVLFEARATFNDGSRAICVARSSYQMLQKLGLEKPFLEKGLPWVSGRSFFRGRQILEFFMADSPEERYRPMYNLEQQYIEAYLYQGVAASELIDMRWQSEVTGLAETDGGVRLTVRDPHGDYAINADWVLAADGARSAIRSRRGHRLKGQNYEGRYVIADIQLKRDCKVERFALFDPDCRPGGTVLVHQQPDNIWRIDYQLRDGESEAGALAENNIRTSIAGVLREIGFGEPWDLEWWSIYSANTLALDDYRDGRIFFIGDSAHIVPIFGVRGLNNGLLDSHNIAWKLACVLQGRASERLLDSYSPERRGATLDVFANASKSARFMTPHTRGYAVLRDAALSLALDHPFAGDFANPRNMTPYTYPESLTTRADDPGFAAGPVPGAMAVDVNNGDGFLLDRFGSGFTVLSFGTVAGLEAVAAVVPGIAFVSQPSGGPAAKRYGAADGSVYLVRPDNYIAARWRKCDGREVAAFLRTLLRGGA